MAGKRQQEKHRLAGVPDFDLLVAAAQACPHGLAIKRDGVIAFANPAYARLLGTGCVHNVIGKSAARLLHAARAAASAQSDGGNHAPDLDSMEMDFRYHGQKAQLEILRDITDRRNLEQQLRVSQKMEALGRAVGGVAHDFNNLLTAVMLYCDLLCQQIPPEAAARRQADEIKLAAQRGAALVRQMLAFARQQVLEPKVLSLNSIVLGMKNMLQRLIGEDLKLVVRCADKLGNVKVDPAQMQQVILNLVVNSRDAMPAGGKLLLQTANLRVNAAQARRYPGLRPGRCVRLTVSDTGCGMTAETLSHIFEPFFTTKEKGKGTGLGLSMVYGIVTQSGGAISVESQLGKGTRVHLLLPCETAKESRAAPAEPVTRALQPAGCETVLVVEDDAAVRAPVVQLLHQAGYKVLQARHGLEAVHISCAHSGPIHLLITDLIMPGLNGHDVVQRVQAQRPETRVLYISGYGDQLRKLTAAEPHLAVLQKPFTHSLLAYKVRQVLDRPQARGAVAGKRH